MTRKKHTEHQRDVKNGIFDCETVVYIGVFHSIFGIFSCFSVGLVRVSLVFWHAQFIMCTIWTYKRALCMIHMYIATKRVFTLISSVWCVCVGHSSRAQWYQKRASTRVPCAFYSFFSLAIRMQGPRLSEKQKKERPNLNESWRKITQLQLVTCYYLHQFL